MVKKVVIAIVMMASVTGCSASDSKYVAVEGVSNADCKRSEYVCVKSRVDETLAKLASFGRVSLEAFCERNGISKSSCVGTALVPKKTALFAGKRI